MNLMKYYDIQEKAMILSLMKQEKAHYTWFIDDINRQVERCQNIKNDANQEKMEIDILTIDILLKAMHIKIDEVIERIEVAEGKRKSIDANKYKKKFDELHKQLNELKPY